MPRHGKRDPELERFWRRTIKAWKRSGESIRGFCSSEGLTQASFYGWRRELGRRDGEPSDREGGSTRSTAASEGEGSRRKGGMVAVPFLPIRVSGASSAPVEIERNGTTIRLHGEVDVEAIAGVLAALERAAC